LDVSSNDKSSCAVHCSCASSNAICVAAAANEHHDHDYNVPHNMQYSRMGVWLPA
jgi:hypothetical protein